MLIRDHKKNKSWSEIFKVGMDKNGVANLVMGIKNKQIK